ncbi:glycosyltransferase family 61 protein [Algoriphagus mannitolivorans]|uniref:glycosyltransferase family 61 protein n=1 Tax=Algoriphagus mannitolivorans TaxID=226504 RepID=UPI00146F9A0B|nr:glycosyltransferase 61 family protein [Algoriphagus mannitolivorans]
MKILFLPRKTIERAVWITDTWSRNYFHWVVECIPRVLELRNRGILSPLLIPEIIYSVPFIKASLDELGIEIISFNFQEYVLIKELYLITYDTPCAFDLDYMWNLRREFLNVEDQNERPTFRKIYISRAKATKRKIENEYELIPILERYGFEVFRTEDLSFKEQRRLFQETKVLFSIHGAGLTNMVFMPAKSKIVELHPDTERYNSCFFHLSSALDIDYLYSFEKADHPNPQEANITVNLNKIENLLITLKNDG